MKFKYPAFLYYIVSQSYCIFDLDYILCCALLFLAYSNNVNKKKGRVYSLTFEPSKIMDSLPRLLKFWVKLLDYWCLFPKRLGHHNPNLKNLGYNNLNI